MLVANKAPIDAVKYLWFVAVFRELASRRLALGGKFGFSGSAESLRVIRTTKFLFSFSCVGIHLYGLVWPHIGSLRCDLSLRHFSGWLIELFNQSVHIAVKRRVTNLE